MIVTLEIREAMGRFHHRDRIIHIERAEWSLPTPKVSGLNPVTDKLLKNIYFLSAVLKRQI